MAMAMLMVEEVVAHRQHWLDLCPGGDIQGFPLWGSVTHPWDGEFEAPLIGCTFHDKNYKNHAGFDSPVSVGTLLHATMGGQGFGLDTLKVAGAG